MRWGRVSVLIDQIKDELEQHGYERTFKHCPLIYFFDNVRYFHFDMSQGTAIKSQAGTVRTNCMDNLDRTNVAQATLAKWTVNKMLQDLRIIPETGGIDDDEAFSKDFRES